MGCCGCTLHSSSITAAVFGFIQGIFGLISASALIAFFQPDKYKSNSINIAYPGYPYTPVIVDFAEGYQKFVTLCGCHIAFNVVWLVSSSVLVYGIQKEHVWCHRQWTIVTSLVLVTDVILTIVSFTVLDKDILNAASVARVVFLIAVLSRFGIIGLICDICLAIYVSQRASEILRGPQVPSTHVIVVGNQPGQQVVIPGGHPGTQIITTTGLPYPQGGQMYQQGNAPPPPAYTNSEQKVPPY